MESSSLSSLSKNDSETEALAALCDAFGSIFSLEEIASAYCQAGRNVDVVGEILFEKHGDCSTVVENPFLDNGIKNPALKQSTSKLLKPKRASASMGSVSRALGKGYSRFNGSSNVHCLSKKPPKIEIEDPLVKEKMWSNMDALDSSHSGGTLENKNVQDFLFSMLGDGFQLSNDVVSNVFGSCGYDAKKSLNKLLNMSIDNLEKPDETKECVDLSSQSSDLELQIAERETAISSSFNHEKKDHAMEILQAWYNVFPKVSDEESANPTPMRKKTRCRTVVSGPSDDICLKDMPKFVEEQIQDANVDRDCKYQNFRESAKKNWEAMKTYYESALDAFLKKDNLQAKYLFEQGKHYHKMYQEACEKSGQLIHETRKVNSADGITLRLHELPPKQALRLLKVNLKSFAGFSTIKALKVIMEADGEDTMKSVRKKLILKLLERESIKWTEEEGNACTITIKLDEIDGRNLSFANVPQS